MTVNVPPPRFIFAYAEPANANEEINVTERAPTFSPEAVIETLLVDARLMPDPVSVRVAGPPALFKIELLKVMCPKDSEPVEIETLVPVFSALLMLDTLILLVARAVKSVPEVKDVPLFDAVDIVTS